MGSATCVAIGDGVRAPDGADDPRRCLGGVARRWTDGAAARRAGAGGIDDGVETRRAEVTSERNEDEKEIENGQVLEPVYDGSFSTRLRLRSVLNWRLGSLVPGEAKARY